MRGRPEALNVTDDFLVARALRHQAAVAAEVLAERQVCVLNAFVSKSVSSNERQLEWNGPGCWFRERRFRARCDASQTSR